MTAQLMDGGSMSARDVPWVPDPFFECRWADSGVS